MHRIFVFFLAAVMLVSHGGASGVVPHAEAEHSHSHYGEHAPPVASNEAEGLGAAGIDLPTSDDMAPAPEVHNHAAAWLLESNSLLAVYQPSRSLHNPGELPRLTGREVAPAPEPPSA